MRSVNSPSGFIKWSQDALLRKPRYIPKEQIWIYLTRGVTFQQLMNLSNNWKHGPSWLISHNLWPCWDPVDVLLTQLQTESGEQEQDILKNHQLISRRSWTSGSIAV